MLVSATASGSASPGVRIPTPIFTAAACRVQVSKEGAEAAEAAKGSYGFGIGEEWLCWLPVTWGLRDFADALDAGGAPAPNAVTQRPDGQWVVDTFPLGCASRAPCTPPACCHCLACVKGLSRVARIEGPLQGFPSSSPAYRVSIELPCTPLTCRGQAGSLQVCV